MVQTEELQKCYIDSGGGDFARLQIPWKFPACDVVHPLNTATVHTQNFYSNKIFARLSHCLKLDVIFNSFNFVILLQAG